jgi:AraC-like DNA-binding protein
MHIVACVRGLRAASRLHRDTRGWARVSEVATTAALERSLASSRAEAVVIEFPSPEAGGLEATVRRIRRDFPSVPVILYCPLTADAARLILRLAHAGLDEVILEGHDDNRQSLQRLVLSAYRSHCLTRSLRSVPVELPAGTRAIVTRSLERADGRMTVRELARDIGVSRKTLLNRLAAAGLPGPATLISRCRLLFACELLEDPARSVEQVALLLGFGSGVALRNMFRRHVGLPPSEVRRRGKFDTVAQQLFRTRYASLPFE